MHRVDDPDDWFEGSEPEAGRATTRRESAGEDWLLDEGATPRGRRPTLDRRILVVAVAGVALLVAVLAAAGVFSSGKSTPAPSVGSTTPLTTSTAGATTTTNTQPARPVSTPTSKLAPGDKGAQVSLLQRALASLGFSTGKVDGQYGPATEAAVKRFQRSVGLTPDGVVGQKTLAALARAGRAA